MKELVSYFEYRNYLRDYYEERKSKDSFFSYRFMANRLDMDHSLLIKIISGKRHISDSAIEQFCRFLKLSPKEQNYFTTLVAFEKSRREAQRKELFEKLLSLQSYSKTTLNSDRFEYFRHWYYPAIRSLLDFYIFKGDYKELSKKLNPQITPLKAENGIKLLERLKLIKKNNDGVYSVTDTHITTGDTWKSIAVNSYQQEAIRLSADSLVRDAKEIRDISSITMSIDQECFDDIREILRECRETIIKRVGMIEGDTDRLYQLNIQAIPLSTIPQEKSDDN